MCCRSINTVNNNLPICGRFIPVRGPVLEGSMIFRTFLVGLFSMVLASHCVLASSSEDEFDGAELKKIRLVSQSILKVRGQRRSQVSLETQGVREAIALVNETLREAEIEINKPVLGVLVKSTFAEVTGKNEPVPLMQRISRFVFDKDEVDVVEPKISEKFTESVVKAKKVLSQQRDAIQRAQPAAWRVWQDRDEGQERVAERLVALERELEEIMNGGEDRSSRIKQLRKRLNRSEISVDEPKKLEPTITTITKHHRK